VLWIVLWLAKVRCRICAGPTDMVTSEVVVDLGLGLNLSLRLGLELVLGEGNGLGFLNY
jgi:hypothetical protein